MYGPIDHDFQYGLLSGALRRYAEATLYRIHDAVNGRILRYLHPACQYYRLDRRILLSFCQIDVERDICVLVCKTLQDVSFYYVSNYFRFGFNEIRRQEIRHATCLRQRDALYAYDLRRFTDLISAFCKAKGCGLSQTIVINYRTGFAFDACLDTSFLGLFVQRNGGNYRDKKLYLADLLRDRNANVRRFRAVFGTRYANDGRNERLTR